MQSFTFVDTFAGIGGFRLALESVGGKCIASSEIDKTALDIYSKNWPNDNKTHHLGDITKISELPQHDLFVGGVPCQSWSIAGKNRGIEDPRGALWNDVIRLIDKSLPTAFLLENVKGLADPRHRDALDYLISSFKQMDYHVYFRVLNSFDFGVPQNRDRIFIVGIKAGQMHKEFEWPKHVEHHPNLYEILDNLECPKKHQMHEPIQRDIFGQRIGVGHNKLTPKHQKNPFFILTDIRNGPTSIHSWEIQDTTDREKTICLTILKNRRKPLYGPLDGNPMSFADLQQLLPDLEKTELESLIAMNILKKDECGKYEFVNRRLSGGINGIYRVFLPNSPFFATITASGTKDVISTVNIEGETDEEYKQNFIDKVLKPKMYRTLQSHELAALQGYPKNFILHEKLGSNTKLFGNSVSVPVIRALALSILNTGCFDEKPFQNIKAI